jgi:hypothetical protein
LFGSQRRRGIIIEGLDRQQCQHDCKQAQYPTELGR